MTNNNTQIIATHNKKICFIIKFHPLCTQKENIKKQEIGVVFHNVLTKFTIQFKVMLIILN